MNFSGNVVDLGSRTKGWDHKIALKGIDVGTESSIDLV